MTLDDALAAHTEALTYGGLAGVINLGLIKSALARPYSGYHRPISRKAAALMEALVQNHGFADGNKRTALIVTELLIRRSGYFLELNVNEQIDDIIVEIARGNIRFDELSQWFKVRLFQT